MKDGSRQVKSHESLPVYLDGDRLTFLSDACIGHNIAGVPIIFEAPEGYSWDGASIPRWAWSIMGHPLEGDLRFASLVHDWLCEHSETAGDRMFADAVFFKLLEEAGLSRWRRMCLWAAVRFYAVAIWRRRQ